MSLKDNLSIVFLIFCVSFFIECSTTTSTQPGSSSVKSEKAKKDSDFKPYDEIITHKAITDEGLFYVHSIDEKLYYEIPDSLLNREILLVSRIVKMSTEYCPFILGGVKVGDATDTIDAILDDK